MQIVRRKDGNATRKEIVNSENSKKFFKRTQKSTDTHYSHQKLKYYYINK